MDSLSFNHTLGFSTEGEKRKENLFRSFHEVYSFHETLPGKLVMRTLGAFNGGVSLALYTLTTKVLTITEIVFKGLGNIFSGEFKEGLKQLLLALPCALIDLAIGGPLHAIRNIVVDTLGLMISPEEYSQERADWHEMKKEQLEASKETAIMLDRFRSVRKEIGISQDDNFIEKQIKISEYGRIKSLSENAALFNNIIYGEVDFNLFAAQ